ncbi:MAG: methylmalonate-semialdehyde dehydrogenase (CoA acylating), partial [Shewanella sp.]
MITQVKHYIDGEFTHGSGERHIDVTNPANNSVIAQINCATTAEVELAIDSA